MTFRDRVFGPAVIGYTDRVSESGEPYDRYWEFGSREITVTDVRDVVRALKGVEGSAVSVHRSLFPSEDVQIPRSEITDLEDASDSELEAVSVIAARPDAAYRPVIVVALGSKRDATVTYCRAHSSEGSAPPDIAPNADAWEQAASRAVEILRTAGRRRLSRKRKVNALTFGFMTGLVGLWVWSAVLLWPSVPVIAALAIALAPALSALPGPTGWVRRNFDNADRKDRSASIKVVSLTRDEWRRQRWNTRRDIKVALYSVLGTLAAGAISYVISEILLRT